MNQYQTNLKNSTDIARRVAQEGMVLLENNGTLPLLKDSRVAVFGIGQIDYVQAGSGSGTINSEYSINLLTGLRNNGKLKVDEDLAAIYEAYYKSEKSKQSESSSSFLELSPKIPEMPLSEAVLANAALHSKIAILTCSRSSGEGKDRELTRGDYYLSGDEEDLFAKVRVEALNAPGENAAKYILGI